MEWFCAIRAAKQKVLQEKDPNWDSDKVHILLYACYMHHAVHAHTYVDQRKAIKRFHKMWIHAENSFRNNKSTSPAVS